MDLHDSDETGIQVVRLRLLAVQNLHWERSSWDGEDGRFTEILRELHSIQCSRGHNQLQLFALLYDPLGHGHGGHTTGLRAADLPPGGVAGLRQVLSDLCGLTRPCFADYN
ncbi:hypothetical protein F7725_014600 [Dissostichus mawsoni]|uniref:Uncharacterized protein n=1 Tax=Dissostichus mawsoni TaxID=36200 RepID=A0A7J5YWD4_DISMA|nr:hypothetical protein F7725_014600 [Dissostichus mawsoni]